MCWMGKHQIFWETETQTTHKSYLIGKWNGGLKILLYSLFTVLIDVPLPMAQKNKMAENILLIFYIWMSRDFQNTEFWVVLLLLRYRAYVSPLKLKRRSQTGKNLQLRSEWLCDSYAGGMPNSSTVWRNLSHEMVVSPVHRCSIVLASPHLRHLSAACPFQPVFSLVVGDDGRQRRSVLDGLCCSTDGWQTSVLDG